MLFNSFEFVEFYLAVFIGCLLLRGRGTSRKALLLLASYWFYMAWSPPFVLLLWFSTLLDYVAGRRMARASNPRVRVAWLVASCTGNLGVLAFFKYGDFFLSNIWAIMPEGVEYPVFFTSIVLPVGISFYTFQSMSYTIDVFRRDCECETNFLDFSLYVAFFPQLVAGPILRSTEFLPQLKEPRRATGDEFLSGVDQAARGFVKKILLADPLGGYVNMIYASPGEFGAFNHLLAAYAFAFQIYFDFSGYTDIAIGSARMLGYRVPPNFNLPYLSRNPSEFWTRWHISLSSWLRDYLYISLGGNRGRRHRTYRNLLLTMLLGGLWHGAAWGFLLWGAFHGLWLVVHRALFRDRAGLRVPAPISIVITFHLVCVSWVFFRAASLTDAMTVFGQLFDFETSFYLPSLFIFLILAVSFASHILGASEQLKRWWAGVFPGVKGLWYAAVAIAIFLFSGETSEFIYFQF